MVDANVGIMPRSPLVLAREIALYTDSAAWAAVEIPAIPAIYSAEFSLEGEVIETLSSKVNVTLV